jgi:hypothetical protein
VSVERKGKAKGKRKRMAESLGRRGGEDAVAGAVADVNEYDGLRNQALKYVI